MFRSNLNPKKKREFIEQIFTGNIQLVSGENGCLHPPLNRKPLEVEQKKKSPNKYEK